MEEQDEPSHSFIVKVWLERTRSAVHGPTWRGRITHVPSGERQYVDELDGIALFIAPRLAALGVRLGPVWHMRRWFFDHRRSRRLRPPAAASTSIPLEEESRWP